MPDKPSIAQADKASIGQMLRKQREERGLSPEQAAYQSKVPLRLLQALEADDYRMLPDPAYLIRFLHEYALLLKLDSNALEVEFRNAIRRPPGASLVPVASPPPPPISWKHVLWTAAAILVVTPLVFIALSLASKRAVERPSPPRMAERAAGQHAPVEEAGPAPAEQIPAAGTGSVQSGTAAPPGEVPATRQTGTGSPELAQKAPPSPSAKTERLPRRLFLTARATETTWMAVRGDDGQERRVLLQKGQIAHFASDTRFVVTVGNAGGVELRLNGKLMPSLGKSGQVVRDLVLPPVVGGAEAVGASSPGAAAQR
jgi:cytoskeleton protein RodZ